MELTFRRFTRDEYHRLAEIGVLNRESNVGLLDRRMCSLPSLLAGAGRIRSLGAVCRGAACPN